MTQIERASGRPETQDQPMSGDSVIPPSPIGCKRYTYGVIDRLMTCEQRQEIRQYIFAGHRLDNAHTEITRQSREAYAALRSSMFPRLCEIEALITERPKGRRKLTPEEKSQNVELKFLKQQCKQDPDFQAATKRHARETNARRKPLTSQKGMSAAGYANVTWATAGLIAVSAKQRSAKPGSPPKFKRFEGEGRIGGQHVAGPAPIWTDMLGRKTGNFHVSEPLPGRNKEARVVSFRVRGAEGDTWLEVPCLWHRPLPDDARVCGVELHARNTAGRIRHVVQFVIRSETFEKPCPANQDVVGLDVGWRRVSMDDGRGIPNRLRISALSDGSLWQIDPWKIYRADQLRSDRDVVLLSAMRLVQSVRNDLPAVESLKFMANPDMPSQDQKGKWSSSRGMCKLIKELRVVECSHSVMSDLCAWKKKDFHLWQYECGTRNNGIGHRQNQYRTLLKSLSSRYKYLAIERFPTSCVKRKKGQNRAPNRQRLAASIYKMQTLAAEYFPGDRLVRVNPRNTSRTCPECSHVNPGCSDLILSCDSCGHEWDRDPGAALEIERRGAMEIPGSSRVSNYSTYQRSSVTHTTSACASPLRKSQPLAMLCVGIDL